MKGRANTIRHNEEARGFTLFFVLSLIISLAVHTLFFDHSRVWRIEGFSAESYDTIVPRTFRMKHVEIDPATLEEVGKKQEVKETEQKPVHLPEENPSREFSKESVNKGGDLMKEPSLLRELPTSDSGRAKTQDPRLDEKTINQLMEGSRNAPIIPVDPLRELAGEDCAPKNPAFSSLDSLLDGNEKLSSATAPILMPTDLLFAYDSTKLKPEAAKSLEKLGTLITRNESSRFRIEGHTDSFGSEDYNNSLSVRRAEEVKEWLVRTMGIDPARISTSGLGKSRPLVSSQGTIEQQQLNRRVEIVIIGNDPPTP